MRSGEGSLSRWHLSKDLKGVRESALWLPGEEHCGQREQQVESPGVRECLDSEAQSVQ